MKAPLTQAQKANRSISFGSQQGERPHSLGRELQDLRSDIEEAIIALEGNTLSPVILALKNDPVANTNQAIANLVVHGSNFLAGRAQASIKIFATGSIDNYFSVTSILPGDSFNSWSVILQASAPNTAAATVAVDDVNKTITVSLATDANGVLDGAANNLTALQGLLNGEPDVTEHFVVSAVQGAGADIVSSAVSKQYLSGGEGLGLSLNVQQRAASQSVTITALSDSQITAVASIVIAAAATGENIGVSVQSHTAQSNVCFIQVS